MVLFISQRLGLYPINLKMLALAPENYHLFETSKSLRDLEE
jgi:hypothetical protein